jgi:hypothetical protein
MALVIISVYGRFHNNNNNNNNNSALGVGVRPSCGLTTQLH